MAKRKLEQQLVTFHPPCKKSAYESNLCAPQSTHIAPRRKRKLDSDPDGVSEVTTPSVPCETPARERSPEGSVPVSSKKKRLEESRSVKAAVYKYQDDEKFSEFNTFQFWKTPLPQVDLSEIAAGTCEDSNNITQIATRDVTEEMDS
ncbi:uncharacterized protein C9orf40 homolog [Spea bombifrons]|uniref:uncharacterized protein C9orf40 homolog n=1 Tax=Spea bombifrons TaxID=233779 RepID=UPI00234BD571|nr:uncharacterized protein C9orf40 homolog [Spea bombifrons]